MNKKVTRRDFLKKGSMAGTAVGVLPAFSKSLQTLSRVVIAKDPECYQDSTVNQTRIQDMVDHTVMALTSKTNRSIAYESLFPEPVTPSTTIAIKINGASGDYSPTNTAVTEALKNGLSSMLNGTFPLNNIIVSAGGNARSTNPTVLAGGGNFLLKDPWVDADYIINCPVCWAHWEDRFGITLGLKNTISCMQGNLHLTIHEYWDNAGQPLLSDLNSHPVLKGKQVLVLLDAITGRADGGPAGDPNFTAHTVIASKDPVACDYQGMLLLIDHGLNSSRETSARTVMKLAAQDPFALGTDNPQNMEVVHIQPPWDISVETPGHMLESIGVKVDILPNPSSSGVLFKFPLPDHSLSLTLFDLQGRKVWQKTVPSGSSVHWPGCDMKGRSLPSGGYLYKLVSGNRKLQGIIHRKK